MNVSDMMDIMKTLGIGEVYSDDDSKRIALSFLNLANDQLYAETANINSGIFVNESALVSVPGQNYVTLTQTPFSISRVFPVGTTCQLKGMSVLDFADYQFNNISSSDPINYTNIGTSLMFWPYVAANPYTLNVWYTPERTMLDETTTESKIPYPPSYHRVLVDGALYYLFQDESGFKNPKKENEALSRWDKGRMDLKSYFYGSNRMSINTFENA